MPRIPLPMRLLAVLALAAGLVVPSWAGAQSPPAQGTPVLGASLLTADQLTAWYVASGVTSKSPTPIADLAAYFIDEGQAQGVRGDIAFAQTMLETGYLRFGGIVKPSDLNFSGLGACDSCARGLAFPSAQLSVRAQIQHLYAYAAAHADPALLARPLADIRFTMVRPYGKAALWEQMGNGNWATGPDYASKVLRIWHAMLTYHGIPVPASAPAGGAPDLTVLASRDGSVRLAGWKARRGAVADGVAVLGAPTSSRRGGAVCLLRWDGLGAAAQIAGGQDPCETGTARLRWARLAGPAWHTPKGLSPGDSVAELRALYPRARRAGRMWILVSGREAGRRAPVTRLRAETGNGVVRALWVHPARG
ncbi:MAG: glucosaminidase domain-containing protein [Thermoleophilia bacterium]